MFEVIGTLHSYAQQYQLKKSAKQKVKTGQTFDWKDARSTFVKAQEETRETKSVFEMYAGKTEKNEETTKSARKSSIKQKLRRGKKLSPQDLEYLRQNDEALYEKAKTTMEEREKLERALKAAKTKAEAQRAVAIAYANAAALMSGNIGGGASAGVSSGGGEAAGADAGAAVGAEGGASSFDAGASVSAEGAAAVGTGAADINASGADNVSADAAGAEGAAEAAGADAANDTANAETGEKVAQENKDAVSSLQQMSQDAEFDDPLILLVLRHLKAEWNDFMRSKTYRDLPEDEIQEAKRHGIEEARRQRRAEGVKAVSLTAVASAYQTAKIDNEASHVLGTVGAAN
ncbi:MAG: hypothetical protein J5477_05150 [Schwartzia sp.]|nr:hypothetical protein [Schwartzia sp. (in: firmicutes)]